MKQPFNTSQSHTTASIKTAGMTLAAAAVLLVLPSTVSAQTAVEPASNSPADRATASSKSSDIIEGGLSIGGLDFREGKALAAQGKLSWSDNSLFVWSLQGLAAAQPCIDHQGGFCPNYQEGAVTWGMSWRGTAGHLSFATGPTVGWYDSDWVGPPRDDGRDEEGMAFGGLLSGEAYFTPVDSVGFGVEVPLRLNTRTYSVGLLMGVKVGDLGVSHAHASDG